MLGSQKNCLNEQPKHNYIQTDGLEDIYNFTLRNFVYLNLWIRTNVDLGPNHLTLIMFLKEFFKENNFEKGQQTTLEA